MTLFCSQSPPYSGLVPGQDTWTNRVNQKVFPRFCKVTCGDQAFSTGVTSRNLVLDRCQSALPAVGWMLQYQALHFWSRCYMGAWCRVEETSSETCQMVSWPWARLAGLKSMGLFFPLAVYGLLFWNLYWGNVRHTVCASYKSCCHWDLSLFLHITQRQSKVHVDGAAQTELSTQWLSQH